MTTLIIDLDETLVHSYESPTFLDGLRIYSDPQIFRDFHRKVKTYSINLEKNGVGVKIWGIFRPHTKEFLDFVYKYFDHVVIWSAGSNLYVQEIVDQMVKDFEIPHGKVIWSREKCQRHAGNFHKPIAQLGDDLKNRYYTDFRITPEKTLVLDDKVYTFMDNPQNGVLIPPFHPGEYPDLQALMDTSDHALLDFMKWLSTDEVQKATDYRVLQKDKIFA